MPRRLNVCVSATGSEQELSDLLDGATVDLRTAQDLSRYFRDEVVKEAELQYAA